MSDLEIYDVVIVGGGLSSLLLARELAQKKILIIDKAKSLGGRVATRRIGDLSVNQGLDQFEVTDTRLKKWIDLAVQEKILEVSNNQVKPLNGINLWAKSLGNGIPFLAQTAVTSFKINHDHIEVYGSEETPLARCKKIVLSPPAPQAKNILEKSSFKANFLEEARYTSSIRFYVLSKQTLDLKDFKLLRQKHDSFLYAFEMTDPLPESYQRISRDELHQSFLSLFNIPNEMIIDSYTHRWLYSQVKKPLSQEFQLSFKDQNVFLLGDYFSGEGVNGIITSVFHIIPYL